jgi:divalent metal cation (Fe/Co/Zn/Cd) transporter
MKAIIYVFGIAFAIILAPIAGLAIGFITFFACFFAFIEGVHDSLMKNLFGEIQEEEAESENIWEKHINRIKSNKNKNEK